MADRSVRVARVEDAAAVSAAQAAAWRARWSDSVPGALLAALDSAEAVAAWRQAIASPPSPRHRVLVAEDAGEVVGMVALEPAQDADLADMVDVEVVALAVRPEREGRGHGSRLLAAAVDIARGDGFRHAYAWLPATDERARAFLVSAGWAPDGTHRRLELDAEAEAGGGGAAAPVQVRLHTDITEDA